VAYIIGNKNLRSGMHGEVGGLGADPFSSFVSSVKGTVKGAADSVKETAASVSDAMTGGGGKKKKSSKPKSAPLATFGTGVPLTSLNTGGGADNTMLYAGGAVLALGALYVMSRKK